MADPLAHFWVHTVTVRRHLEDQSEGDLYDAPAVVPCFIDDKRRLVRGPTGEQVVSETTIALPSTVAAIPVDSLVTLPATFGGRVTRVLATSVGDAGALPTPNHAELALA